MYSYTDLNVAGDQDADGALDFPVAVSAADLFGNHTREVEDDALAHLRLLGKLDFDVDHLAGAGSGFDVEDALLVVDVIPVQVRVDEHDVQELFGGVGRARP